MNTDSLSIEIRGIEAEIKTLKDTLARLTPSEMPERSHDFSELYGIWKGKLDLSLEEIKAEKCKTKDFPRGK